MLLKVAVSVLALSRRSEEHPVVDFGCHLSVASRQKLNNAAIKKTQQPSKPVLLSCVFWQCHLTGS
jgi:hypothetical protein